MSFVCEYCSTSLSSIYNLKTHQNGTKRCLKIQKTLVDNQKKKDKEDGIFEEEKEEDEKECGSTETVLTMKCKNNKKSLLELKKILTRISVQTLDIEKLYKRGNELIESIQEDLENISISEEKKEVLNDN